MLMIPLVSSSKEIAVHPCELPHSGRTCGGLKGQENVLWCCPLRGWADKVDDYLVRNRVFSLLQNYVIQKVWTCRCQENDTAETSASDLKGK